MKKRILIYGISALWWCAMMVLLSQKATDSEALSGGILDWIVKVLPFLEEYRDELHTPLRKLAHFFGYAIEGFLLTKAGLRDANVPVGAGMSVAGELVQLLSPGRSCSPQDMAIDFSGYILGAWCAAKVFVMHKHTDKEQGK